MKITNRLGLPQPLVDAVSRDPYISGQSDYSVTELLRPARQVILEKTYKVDLEEDASDRIWSLMGQIVHGIFERADKDAVSEKRFYLTTEGKTISGQVDRYIDGLIQDYKVVTLYKFMNNKVPLEYEQQLNCYAALLRHNGYSVNKLQIVGILRDWSKLEAMRERENGYPQAQVLMLDVPLWTNEDALEFMRRKVFELKQASVTPPLCSEEERWAKPPVFALMKEGRERAVKLYTNQKDAENHASTDPSLRVQIRPSVSVRCESYCSVARFCTQRKSL